MTSPLRILHVEDDPIDAALVQTTLEAGGIACAINCVHRRDEFVAALEHGGFDLILSDYTLPAFDSLRRNVGFEYRARQMAGHTSNLRVGDARGT